LLKLNSKEVEILRFVRRSRHKTTVPEIAGGLNLSPAEVETFVRGMVIQKLLNSVPGATSADDSYYTNPEKREEIYALIG